MRRLALPMIAVLDPDERNGVSLRKILVRHWRATFDRSDETVRIVIGGAA